jgi:hypothetical protein
MVALTSCHGCRGVVSTLAVACPHCGAPPLVTHEHGESGETQKAPVAGPVVPQPIEGGRAHSGRRLWVLAVGGFVALVTIAWATASLSGNSDKEFTINSGTGSPTGGERRAAAESDSSEAPFSPADASRSPGATAVPGTPTQTRAGEPRVQPPTATVTQTVSPTLRHWLGTPLSQRLRSDYRGDVAEIQGELNGRGYGPLEVDGYYGPSTATAVRNFQADSGLDADGVVGPRTWAALFH